MVVGDRIQLVGTVRDIVDDSVLIVTDDSMHQREYWLLSKHVTILEPPTTEGAPAVPVAPDHGLPGEAPTPPEEAQAPVVPDQTLPGISGKPGFHPAFKPSKK